MKNIYVHFFTLVLVICFSFLIINYHEVSIYTVYYDANEDGNKGEDSSIGAISKTLEEYNNSDVVGFINIPGVYQSVIVQSLDNDFYLNHAIDKSYDYRGTVFLDYRVDINKSSKLLIYGHSSKYEELEFNFLQNYYSDASYYNKNKYIELITYEGKKRYEVFSVYVEVSDFSYMKTNFYGKSEYLTHINSFKEKSIYSSDVSLDSDDEILILQTCSTHSDYDNYEKKYLLVVARRV